jgi:hypothetical protein
MTQFKRGDDVKLTDNYAMALNGSPKARINWLGRRGIVKWSNPDTVSIIWDGTKAQQTVPARGVEKVSHAA